ncbi:MAG: type II toxin-antitoxin system CcdA family antitoxin [Pseudomonadota bacterium]
MGKEKLTIEVDAELMGRLRAAGLSPEEYVERLVRRNSAAGETDAQREARHAALRAEMKEGMDAYERLIDEVGDWSADLRTF